jgi:hypothetical protein
MHEPDMKDIDHPEITPFIEDTKDFTPVQFQNPTGRNQAEFRADYSDHAPCFFSITLTLLSSELNLDLRTFSSA